MSPIIHIHRDIPDPTPGARHDTLNSQLLVFLLTLVAMSLLVLIWRRASSWKSVVQHRLKDLTSPDGAIRLPAEDGPPEEIFNQDEDLDADDSLDDTRRQVPANNTSVGRD